MGGEQSPLKHRACPKSGQGGGIITKEYRVVKRDQVFLGGTWADGDWIWEEEVTEYRSKEAALRGFRKLKADARLYEVTHDGLTIVKEELLDEI